MSTVSITKAFEVRLKAFFLANALPVAWENSNFVPPAGAYAEPYMLFARPESLGFKDEHTRQLGYCQVTLRYPLNAGAGNARRMGDLLALDFKRGLSLVADGITATVEETPEVGNGIIEVDRYVVRIKIRFFANILKDA